MNDELFTTTPPNEMAEYWLQNEAGDELICFRMVTVDGDVEWCGFDMDTTDQDVIEAGYLFGPKVPSAKEYAELKEKARKWDLLDANFVDLEHSATCRRARAIVESLFLPDYRIPLEQLERLNSMTHGSIIDTSWDNPTGDIPGDLAAINEAFTKLIGRE